MSELIPSGNDADTIVRTAQAAAEPHTLPDEPVGITVPDGYRHQIIDRHLAAPPRARGDVQLHEPNSLIDYLGRHKTDATQWYVDVEGARLIAVLNDHGDEPGWRDHRATVALRHSPEWQAWKANDRKLMSQEQFAEHIEQNRPDVVTPDAADLLEIVQTFQATNNAAFKRGVRLDNGEVQFTYTEDIKASGGRDGQLTVPDTFVLSVAPFFGGDPVEVTASLRYRVRDGQLTIGYVLLRPERVINDALLVVVNQVQNGVGIDPLYGVAPAAL